ncbi:MAG: c-type cytochrome [Gemmatimonadaceae bacterium]|nr:c-type cytochrome [Gemmatimonadaceae bacterium]MDQ3517815.1 c-type cytochrome [Gemmatimonadota bacterium]
MRDSFGVGDRRWGVGDAQEFRSLRQVRHWKFSLPIPHPPLPRAVLSLFLISILSSCSWFTDFKDQPRIEPWEAEMAGNDTTPFRGNPQFSVPVYGSAVPGFMVSRGAFLTVMPAVVDSMAGLENPTAGSDSSIENGRKYYQINCTVCHGVAGAGNGPALNYGIAAPSLINDRAKGLSDGYYFGIIRNGRGSMPNYNRIEEMDRWDVVNYIRGLQGVGKAVSTEFGVPGETGDKVPGVSRTAPTRPAPFYRPGGTMTPDSAAMDSVSRGGGPGDSAAAASPRIVDTSASRLPPPASRSTPPPAARESTPPSRP